VQPAGHQPLHLTGAQTERPGDYFLSTLGGKVKGAGRFWEKICGDEKEKILAVTVEKANLWKVFLAVSGGFSQRMFFRWWAPLSVFP
jgi:hypothetical protein